MRLERYISAKMLPLLRLYSNRIATDFSEYTYSYTSRRCSSFVFRNSICLILYAIAHCDTTWCVFLNSREDIKAWKLVFLTKTAPSGVNSYVRTIFEPFGLIEIVTNFPPSKVVVFWNREYKKLLRPRENWKWNIMRGWVGVSRRSLSLSLSLFLLRSFAVRGIVRVANFPGDLKVYKGGWRKGVWPWSGHRMALIPRIRRRVRTWAPLCAS